MNDGHKEEIIVSATILVALALVLAALLIGCHECESTNRAAIKAGLVDGSQSGAMHRWTKQSEIERNK